MGEDINKNIGMVKAFTIIIEPLIQIYTREDQVPITINLACKSLNCLTSDLYFAKESINYLLKYNIFYVILKYLNYPFEKVVFNTLNLLDNILPSTALIIDKILAENPNLINKLIFLLKTKNEKAAKTFCSTRV